MQEEDINRAKAAMDRLSGCELNHLSLAEAKLIQALRNNGYSESDFDKLLSIITTADAPAVVSSLIFTNDVILTAARANYFKKTGFLLAECSMPDMVIGFRDGTTWALQRMKQHKNNE